jgi:transposase-like protein
MKCPSCGANWQQWKAGFNHSGSQRYKCGECKRAYTPATKEKGYAKETRLLALRMYVEGNSQRAIARILKISPQSVSNWINAYASKLPPTPMPAKPKVAELDELYTFLKQKKRKSTF